MRPKLYFNWIDDEECEVIFDDKLIMTINHGEHGWAGMESILHGFEAMADAAHIPIEVLGEPGV